MKPIVIISLAAFQAGVKSDLTEGRRVFNAAHSEQIKALTLTKSEVKAITPNPSR